MFFILYCTGVAAVISAIKCYTQLFSNTALDDLSIDKVVNLQTFLETAKVIPNNYVLLVTSGQRRVELS